MPVAAKKKHGGFGFLGAAASMAMPFASAVMPIGGVAGGVLASGAGAVAQGAQNSMMQRQMDGSMAQMPVSGVGQPSIETQRKNRLMAMYETKQC